MNKDDFDLLKSFMDIAEDESQQNIVGGKWKSEINYSFLESIEQVKNIALSAKTHFVFSINDFGVFFFVKTRENDGFNMSDIWMPYYTTQEIFKEADVFKDNSIEFFEKEISVLKSKINENISIIDQLTHEIVLLKFKKWYQFWK